MDSKEITAIHHALEQVLGQLDTVLGIVKEPVSSNDALLVIEKVAWCQGMLLGLLDGLEEANKTWLKEKEACTIASKIRT